jgi:hypothetical protein
VSSVTGRDLATARAVGLAAAVFGNYADARARDLGDILIAEKLAIPFACGTSEDGSTLVRSLLQPS